MVQFHLLIRVHQDERVFQLILCQDCMELLPRNANALCVAAVHDINDRLRQRDQRESVIAEWHRVASRVHGHPHKPGSMAGRSRHTCVLG